MKIKALITDVDGTLVPNRSNDLPSEQVIESVIKAQEQIHVGLATARPYGQVKHLFDGLKMKGPSILSGGAQLINAPGRDYIYERYLDRENVLQICDLLKKKKMNFWIQDDGLDYDFDKNYRPYKPFVIAVHNVDIGAIQDVKRLIHEDNHVATHTVQSSEKGKADIHITDPEATKQHGLIETAKILKIDRSQIIGVGDSNNDFPLLMACGIKIAVESATQELKEIADYIAPAAEDGAIAWVLEKFVLNK